MLGQLVTEALPSFPKSLVPWRDSNPGLLFLRRMRCLLRHAAGASQVYIMSRQLSGVVSHHLSLVPHFRLVTTWEKPIVVGRHAHADQVAQCFVKKILTTYDKVGLLVRLM
jgi:hypothetical protein